MTLLRESTTLLGVEVHVVGPDLEGLCVEVGAEVGREVEIDADLVVLQGNEGEVKTRIAVEEEDEGKVDSLAVTRSGHLTPVEPSWTHQGRARSTDATTSGSACRCADHRWKARRC